MSAIASQSPFVASPSACSQVHPIPSTTNSNNNEGGQFAALFEAACPRPNHNNSADSPRTDSLSHAAAGDSGQEESKRQNHFWKGQVADQLTHQSVNSASKQTEKRHDAGTSDFDADDNAKQRYSANSSQSDNKNESRNRDRSSESSITQRNHLKNNTIAIGTPPALPTSNLANAVGLALPEQQFKKLVRVLRNTSLSKRTRVFLTLDLGSLGEVKLNVTLNGKKVSITAQVSDHRAGAALSFALGKLKTQLADIDLTLEQFEIKKGLFTANNDHVAGNADAILATR